jgi:hypothetical protein
MTEDYRRRPAAIPFVRLRQRGYRRALNGVAVTVILHVSAMIKHALTRYELAVSGCDEKENGCRGMRQIAYSWFLCVGALSSHPIAALAADSFQSDPSQGQQLVEKGANLYALRCEGCHGENLHNTSGGWSFDLRRLRPDEHVASWSR